VIKNNQKIFLWAGVAVVVLILIYTAFSERGLFKVRQLLYDRDSIKAQIKHTMDENIKLKREAAALSNDMHTIERTAREQLDLIKKNEILYKFGDKK